MKKTLLLAISLTISAMASESLNTITDSKATKILESIYVTDSTQGSSDYQEKQKLFKKMQKQFKDQELSNEDLNTIFLSFYEEYKRLQKLKDKSKQKATINSKPDLNTHNSTPIAPSLEEQMKAFQKQLALKNAMKNKIPQEEKMEMEEDVSLFGTVCSNHQCKLITEDGYRKVGDRVNGKRVAKIDRYSVIYEDGSKTLFIVE